MNVTKDQMLTNLEKIRQDHGEEAYITASKGVAFQVLNKPGGEEYIKKVLSHLDIEQLKEEAKAHAPAPEVQPSSGTPEEAMLNMLRQQLPNLRTQAQFNIFNAGFDALRVALDSAFGGDTAKFEKAKQALLQVFDLAHQSKVMADKLQDLPEAATSKEAEEHKGPPKQFHEYDIQAKLLFELAHLRSTGELTKWYEDSKADLEKVVSQTLRNTLFDEIRKKKAQLIQETN
jgi:hypothetical protein